ncbi:MAG: class E sortase [Dermatophilaceae bacterium]
MSRTRVAVGVTGEVLITVGVLLLLFVVWELGYVAVVDNRAQAGVVGELEQQFSQPTLPPDASVSPDSDQLTDGSVFAILRVPRLGGSTWAKPIYEGVDARTLAKGLGHYPSTQLPGQIGNFAIAGHRAGHGNPLIDIDAIRPGDVMVVETREAYDVYRAERSLIVPPTQLDVIAPVPGQPGVVPTQAYLTVTSCEPRFGSTNRFIVHAVLDHVIARSEGLPAQLLADPRGAS